jgi:outer membrane lipoprotein-sorting protein
MIKRLSFVPILFMMVSYKPTNDIKETLRQVKEKYDKVNDYTATGKLKTNVIFIKAPVATVKVFYKKPDKLKIKNEKGVSLIPKGTMNINLNNVFMLKEYESFDGGKEKINGKECRVIKIFPLDDKNDISRATLYIDETEMLTMKSVVTSKENGTFELVMSYGSQKIWALPDKVEFTFNTREYKLPKGVSIDYDNGTTGKEEKDKKEKKGRVEIKYSNYSINKGIQDEIFN